MKITPTNHISSHTISSHDDAPLKDGTDIQKFKLDNEVLSKRLSECVVTSSDEDEKVGRQNEDVGINGENSTLHESTAPSHEVLPSETTAFNSTVSSIDKIIDLTTSQASTSLPLQPISHNCSSMTSSQEMLTFSPDMQDKTFVDGLFQFNVFKAYFKF